MIINKEQIRADIAKRKAMPEFGSGPDAAIERIHTMNKTQRSFNMQTVEALLDELEKYQQYAKERDAENESLALTVGRMRIEYEAAVKRISMLSESHASLRESMAAIHNTIRIDGASASLSTILTVVKRAYENSAATADLSKGRW